MGTLYLVSTPIGNLEDLTFRALHVLQQVSLIASEDTRRTRKLLARYRIPTRQVSYHEHSPASRLGQLLAVLDEGDVALVSDAGTPGLSDPGYEFVRAAWAAGHVVRPIPGASALLAALVASGLPSDTFTFHGYPPRQAAERRRRLDALALEPGTHVFFEVPHRLAETLTDLQAAFGADRPAAVCRELTKLHEEIRRGSLAEVTDHFRSVEPRGEFTLVVGGALQDRRWSEQEVLAALAERRSEGDSPSRAARHVAGLSGWRRSEVYRLTVEER